MAMDAQESKADLSERTSDWVLIGYMVCLAVVYFLISGRRFFNFDEFQVMYASAAIIRKGSLYHEGIGTHFPLANLVMSLPGRLVGFDAVVLVISRYIILALNGIMLLYAYRIGLLLFNRKAALLAVCMIMSSFVFLEKGIEIRHDVFNALFIVMGIYYGLMYLDRRRNIDLTVSAFCLGMAVASTQKALVMAAGFVVGLVIYLIYERDYKSIGKMFLGYFFLAPIPLIGCLMILAVLGNDSIEAFLQNSARNVIVAFAPLTEELYPFPYRRLELFKTLFVANPLLYVLGISSIVSIMLIACERRSKRVIIGVCTAVGLTFYVTAKRPFLQTFLPVIPLLAIIGGGLISNVWHTLGKWRPIPRSIVGIICFSLLFALPFPSILKRADEDKRFEKALANVSFCVENLNKDDKVLCFTQNQIFFDPLMKMGNEECGERIYDFDVDCFERKMIQSQCKVVIYDYRTQLLNKEIKRRIAENYIKTGIGDILTPGFHIPPGEIISKEIWIKGSYYSPTRSIEVDGKEADGKIISLEQGSHAFRNITDRPVTLVYIFDPANLKEYLRNS